MTYIISDFSAFVLSNLAFQAISDDLQLYLAKK